MVAIGRVAGDQLGDLTVLVQPYALPVTLGLAGAALALIGWRWRRLRAAALEA